LRRLGRRGLGGKISEPVAIEAGEDVGAPVPDQLGVTNLIPILEGLRLVIAALLAEHLTKERLVVDRLPPRRFPLRTVKIAERKASRRSGWCDEECEDCDRASQT
jgi:hypothetical protein